MGKLSRKLAVGGLAVGLEATVITGTIISVVLGGTGTLIIRNPEVFDGPLLPGGPGSPGGPSGDYMDEYARKIMTLDLDKLRLDNPSKGTDPLQYTGKKNIAEEFETYLLFAEICQRPEINPRYSSDEAIRTSVDAEWVITPAILYGIWAHEAGASMDILGTADGSTDKRGYKMWDPTGGGYVGPFQRHKDLHNVTHSRADWMYMYISRFESAECPDNLRAITGYQSLIQSGNGLTPDGAKVSWAQVSPYVKFTDNIRPSPQFLADSAYTTAYQIRLNIQGNQSANGKVFPHSNLAQGVKDMAAWKTKLNLSDAQVATIMLMTAVSTLSEPNRVSYMAKYSDSPVDTSVEVYGIMPQIYLEMAIQGIPFDFWFKRDNTWCSPTSLSADLNGIGGSIPNAINTDIFGVYCRQPGVYDFTGKNGILQRADAKATQFTNLTAGFSKAYREASKNVAAQTGFPLEALNTGLWMESSIHKMVDKYYGDAKYTKPKPVEPPGGGGGDGGSGPPSDTVTVSPGSIVSGDINGSVYKDYAAQVPKVTVPGAIKTSGGKWYVDQGVLRAPMNGAIRDGGFSYHPPGCGHAYGHITYGHPGLDMHSSVWDPSILSVADGVLVQRRQFWVTDFSDGFGTWSAILHCVNGNYFVSVYAHMTPQSYNQFAVGDVIKKGDLIGWMGATGMSKGGHLHFQLNYNFGTSGQASYGYSMAETWNPAWSITVA